MPAPIAISLLEQSIANTPREIAGRLVEIAGSMAVHTQVVVGLQYPDGATLIARGYELVGDEERGTRITLAADRAERLAEAYNAAMVEKPDGAILQCDSLVDFIMGWRDRPHHTTADAFQFTRFTQYHPTPVDLDKLEDGRPYEFVVPRLYFGEPGCVHMAVGVNKPTHNLSKFGDEALVTMRNVDTANYYAFREQLPAPQELISVSRRPRW